MEAQERFSDDDFVAVTQCLALSRRQSLAPVDKSTVRRSEVFYKVLAIAQSDPGVTARDFCFGIVGIEIDVGEDTAVRVPATYLRFRITQHELLATGAAFFDDQPRMWFARLANRGKTQSGGNTPARDFGLRALRGSMISVFSRTLIAAGRLVSTAGRLI